MKFCGRTDIGKIRTANQDSFFAEYLENTYDSDSKALLCVVCDGMGGAAGGKVASSLAVEAFSTNLKQLICKKKFDSLEELVELCVKRANLCVYSRSTADENLKGMGTTLTAALVTEGKVTVANVGDSRLYAIKNNKIKQITKDHSYVQELLDTGHITKEQAKNHPNKNIITRALGSEEEVKADTFTITEQIDGLVLCSDGLCNFVEEQHILKEFYSGKEVCEMCESLIKKANDKGGKDNITVVVVSFLQS